LRKGDKLSAKHEPSVNENREQVRAQLKQVADKMDQIEKSGGRIPLTDPLHQRAKALRAKLKTMKEDANEVFESYALVHKAANKVLSTHKDEASAKDEWKGLEKEQRAFYKIVKTSQKPKGFSMKEAASPMIAPPKTGKEFGKKEDAFAHAKQHGGKVMKKSFINSRTGQKSVSYVVKEEAQIDELKTSTLTRYGTKATQSLGRDPEKTDKRIKGIQTARFKVQQKAMKKEDLDEAEKMKGKDPCWKGYQMIGTKKGKGGKEVPNCVPKESVKEINDYFRRRKSEEDIISGKKPARKKQPAQTSDYARRREQEKKANESVAESTSYKVDVEGLPVMYISSKSPAEVKANLRKILKKPGSINSVERVMDTDVRKAFRLKAQGKEGMEEGALKTFKRAITGTDAESRAGEEATKMMKAQQSGDNATATKHNNRYKRLVALTKKEGYVQEKLDPSMGAGEYVKDFEKSDAPQFKGKTKKERQKMAVAAYLGAKRGDK
jgi:hypothetical protein